MKTIGLIDYYISEWHANNYPGWIRKQCEALGLDMEVKYVWAELDVSPLDGRTTDQWCRDFGTERCDTIQELCEKSDYILILAPSNPEKHLEYVRRAFPCGKNTYVDKTFAPDLATAEEIFRIAKAHGTRFFSSSALRYASELEALGQPENLITFGGGDLLEEYIIHQVEMVVKLMGQGATRVRGEKLPNQQTFRVEFRDGGTATVVFSTHLPFIVIASPGKESQGVRYITSDFFQALMADILRFYESGTPSFDPAQTLAVMAIRESILKASEAPGQWIPVEAPAI